MTERWEPWPGGAPIDFSIDVELRREAVKLAPAGELDIATVAQLQRQLEEVIEAGFARILIDLRRVEFIDSSAVHALLTAHERAEREGWQLAIVPGRHAVQRLFEITGTIEQLPFTPATSGASNSDSPNSQPPHRPHDVEPAGRARSQPVADPASATYARVRFR